MGVTRRTEKSLHTVYIESGFRQQYINIGTQEQNRKDEVYRYIHSAVLCSVYSFVHASITLDLLFGMIQT